MNLRSKDPRGMRLYVHYFFGKQNDGKSSDKI